MPLAPFLRRLAPCLLGLLLAGVTVPSALAAITRTEGTRAPVLTTQERMKVGDIVTASQPGRLSAQVMDSLGAVHYALDYTGDPASRSAGQGPALDRPAPAGKNSVAHGRLQWAPGGGQQLELSGSVERREPVQDEGLAAPDTRSRASTREFALAWRADWSRRFRSRVSVGQRRRHEGMAWGQGRHSGRQYAALENRWKRGRHAWTTDARQESAFLRTGMRAYGHRQGSLEMGYAYEGKGQALALGLQHSRDSEFGRHAGGSLAWKRELGPHWNASANAQGRMLVPALARRAPYADLAAERPRKQRNAVLRLDWHDGASSAGIAIYRKQLRYLVSGDHPDRCRGLAGCGGTGHGTLSQGLTISGKARVGRLGLGGSLDLQRAVDLDSRQLLSLRAGRLLKLDGKTQLGPWQLASHWQLGDHRFAHAGRQGDLGGYGRLDLEARARLAATWELQIGIDNALDRQYRLSGSRSAPGRTWHVQVQWVPG